MFVHFDIYIAPWVRIAHIFHAVAFQHDSAFHSLQIEWLSALESSMQVQICWSQPRRHASFIHKDCPNNPDYDTRC